ncbi:MAG: YncE family protein [Puia sp.]|nr:YncE family protein [Puia sp.]
MKPRALITCLSINIFLLGNLLSNAQNPDGFRVTANFSIASPGGWDYIAAGPGNNRIYVSHGGQVNILDETTGDSVGVIPNTTGVHGIAFNASTGKGYTSNGRLNTVTVFDLKTNEILAQIPAGQNPDAIFFEPFSKLIITCNGRSNDLSLIDPARNKVVATIPVGGKPETAVSDGAGRIFVNIEDKNEIAVIDLAGRNVVSRWSLAPAEGPTGLAIDLQSKCLFAGCDKTLVVMDATNGKIVATLPIGNGCDGVGFDPQLKDVFASCGEGVLSIIKEGPGKTFTVLGNLPTKRSARTIAVDENLHKVFLPAADLEKTAAAHERPKMIPGTFGVVVVSQK